jgi:hypothetical protein
MVYLSVVSGVVTQHVSFPCLFVENSVAVGFQASCGGGLRTTWHSSPASNDLAYFHRVAHQNNNSLRQQQELRKISRKLAA